MKKIINQTLSLLSCIILTTTLFTGVPSIQHPTNAETPQEDHTRDSTGIPAGDTGVNPASGTYTWEQNLLSLPGRGVDLNILLRYNNHIWDTDPNGTPLPQNNNIIGVPGHLTYNGGHQYIQDPSPVGLGYDISMGRLYAHAYQYTSTNDITGQTEHHYWHRFSFQAPDGGSIIFGQQDPDYDTGGDENYGYGEEFIALDASGARLIVNTWDETSLPWRPTSMTVILPGGIRYLFSSTEAVLAADRYGISQGSTLDDGDDKDDASYLNLTEWFYTFKKTPNYDPLGLYAYYSSIYNDITRAIQTGNIGALLHLGGGSYNIPPQPQELEEVGSAAWACYAIQDTTGNQITIQYYDQPSYDNPVRVLSLPQTITDTYGRVVTFNAANATETIPGTTYPAIRLTSILSTCTPNDGVQTISFNYQNQDNSPYIEITQGPFNDQPITTTGHGSNPSARTRTLLTSITNIPPTGTVRTMTFTYNTFSELDTITLPSGGSKHIRYGITQVASCYQVSEYGFVGDTGYQDQRIVTEIIVDDGTGQTMTTTYEYQIDTEDGQPLTTGFHQVNAINGITRTEYHYYTDTPQNTYPLISPPAIPVTLAATLSGVLKENCIYEDTDHTDDNPGILRSKTQLFYGETSQEYDHIWHQYQQEPFCSYGNYWHVILPMGYTTWKDGQESFTINGYGGNHVSGGYLGCVLHWQITGGEWTQAVQNQNDDSGYQISLWFSITAANPETIKFQKNTYTTNTQYRNRGLPALLQQTKQGYATTHWAGNYGEILILPNAGEDYFTDSDYSYYPFEYHTILTTQFNYDEEPLTEPGTLPTNYQNTYINPGTTSLGLLSSTTTLETETHTEIKYYTNGLLYQTITHPDTDKTITTTYQYGDQGDGTDHGHNWAMLSQHTTTTPTYGTTTTRYQNNPLGQITKTIDVENNEETSQDYDDTGRPTITRINNQIISRNYYTDTPLHSTTLTQTYTGGQPAQNLITQTINDGLNRPTKTIQGTISSPSELMKTISYNTFSQIITESLPQSYPHPDDHRAIHYTYDATGRIHETTDPMGRTITTETTAIPSPGEEGYNVWLWDQGIRTKTSTWSTTGAAQDTYTNAQGQTVRNVQRISENPLVLADTTYNYDNQGRLYAQKTPEGLTTHYYYDALGRLVGIDTPDETADYPLHHGDDYIYPNDDYIDPSDAHADTITKTFTISGQPTCIQTPNGYFFITYDEYDRIIRKEHADTQNGPRTTLVEYSYQPSDAMWPHHAHGRLALETYYNPEQPNLHPNTIRYAYNTQGQISCMEYIIYNDDNYPLIKLVQFEYDRLGRPTQITYPEGDKLTYTYEGANLIEIKRNNAPLARYHYDDLNRETSLILGDKTVQKCSTYNDLTDTLQSFIVKTKNTIKPDQTIKTPLAQGKWNTVLMEQYQYDTQSGLLTQKYTSDGSYKPRISRQYTYDLLGRLTQANLYETIYTPTTQSYIPGTINDYVNIEYNFDKDGLRTSRSLTYTESQQPRIRTLTQYYTYTPGTHQLASVTQDTTELLRQTYNTAGSVQSRNNNKLTRNCLDQLTSYQNEQYSYSAGVRVKRTNAQHITTYSLCLGQNTIAEYDENGVLLISHFYADGSRIASDPAGSAKPIEYLVSDAHGDVRCIITSNGVLQQRIEYTPYGEQIFFLTQDK